MKHIFITQTIAFVLSLFSNNLLNAQNDEELFTYTLYHNVSGKKVYVTGFDSAATYIPDYNALLLFINNHMKAQRDLEGNPIQGKVYISFIVEKDGSLTDLKIIKSLTDTCDAEVLRVLSHLPNAWRPAMLNHKPVRSQFNLPVQFK